MGCSSSKETANNDALSPLDTPEKVLKTEKEPQPSVIPNEEAKSPVTSKSEVQASIVNDADVQPSALEDSVEQPDTAKIKAEDEIKKAEAKREPASVESTVESNKGEVVTEAKREPAAVESKAEMTKDEVVADAKREPENHDEENLEKEPAQVQAVENGTERDSKKTSTEQKEEQGNTTALTKAIADEVNPPKESSPVLVTADADASDSATDAEGKDPGPPLLTIDGDHIRRHSDTTKKLFQQLAQSSDPNGKISKKDFMQYFRNQGATNLTSRRLYSKFNPKNTPAMDFDEFQANLLANTYREGEEVNQ